MFTYVLISIYIDKNMEDSSHARIKGTGILESEVEAHLLTAGSECAAQFCRDLAM